MAAVLWVMVQVEDADRGAALVVRRASAFAHSADMFWNMFGVSHVRILHVPNAAL